MISDSQSALFAQSPGRLVAVILRYCRMMKEDAAGAIEREREA